MSDGQYGEDLRYRLVSENYWAIEHIPPLDGHMYKALVLHGEAQRNKVQEALAHHDEREVLLDLVKEDKELYGRPQYVAIKHLSAERAQHPLVVRAFIREADIARQLSHDNIAHYVDDFWDRRDGHNDRFMIYRYEESNNLRVWIDDNNRMKRATESRLPQVVGIGVQVCRALEYAYTVPEDGGRPRRIVHGDLSPENILVSTTGEVKLVDFGSAEPRRSWLRRAIGRFRWTREVLGSLPYMSPEQAQLEPLDNRSDLFVLGIVLYEMIAGKPPYTGTDATMMACCRRGGISSAKLASLPAEMRPLVLKALRRNPRRRFREASEMIEALVRL